MNKKIEESIPEFLKGVEKNITTKLFVKYGDLIQFGQEIKQEKTIKKPDVSFHVNGDGYYTLMMIDLDKNEWLHWLIINIPSRGLYSDGLEITKYKSASEQDHRYVLGLFEQSSYIKYENIDEIKRNKWDSKKILEKYNLKIVGINYFKIKSFL